MSTQPKNIHVRVTKPLDDDFSIFCIKRGLKKQHVLEWLIRSVADEDPRIIELIEELIESQKENPNDLTDHEIEELRKLIGS